MKNILQALLYLSLLCFIGLVVVLIVDPTSPAIGPLMATFFVCLALGVRGTETVFKSYAFALWVFSSVTLAMFYPDLFLRIGDFKLSVLIVPLIQLIMFGMGTSLSVKDFVRVITMPRAVIIGLVLQFSIMPLLGISLALAFRFPAEIAAGVVLIGSSPGGIQCNGLYCQGEPCPLGDDNRSGHPPFPLPDPLADEVAGRAICAH